MANDGLRTQFPYGGGLSPRPFYDLPSPTSNYASSVAAASPGFFPMAYNISPRFAGSAFIPSADVFGDARSTTQESAPYTPRPLKHRASEALSRDPVAMHLLVETALIDSQNFDILSVEEVEILKQEQKGLDGKLATSRRRLESETKIRDAARSLARLSSRDGKGHQRGLSTKSVKDSARANDELEASNRKVEDLTRELLEIESRMRLIDMQLLMHTSAVLQLTHGGPKKSKQNGDLSNGGDRRPDSPASSYTFENERGFGKDDGFDERSLYRSPENLDSLMNVLQNGTHHHSHSIDQQNQSLNSVGKRLEDLNERLRELIVQANPERNDKYALPPQAGGTPDNSTLERQLEFLDQGLRDIGAEQSGQKSSNSSLAAIEGRLEGINAQLYAMLSASDDNVPPPPAVSGNGFQSQLDYFEDSFYSIERLQYALNDQLDDMRAEAANKGDGDAERFETALKGLWHTIQTGEEEARERKRERRRLLAAHPEDGDELSPDESDVGEEPFSLIAFTSKVQTIFRRAMSLKDKQSILVRQIKQQRELNSKSDAQREEQVNDLREQVLSARSEKMSMETELERAVTQLRSFDDQKQVKDEEELMSLRNVKERNTGLESQVREHQERTAAFESQIREHQERSAAFEDQIREHKARATAFEAQIRESQERSAAYEAQVREIQERSNAYEVQIRDAEERKMAHEAQMQDVQQRSAVYEAQVQEAEQRRADYEAQIRDTQGRVATLEAQLKEAQNEARVEAAAIQTELTQSSSKIEEASIALRAATVDKEQAETRAADAATALSAKEEELRNLEGEVVRLTTELTFAKAELDGAYGTRAQRAAESGAVTKKELDELVSKNVALVAEIAALQKLSETASQSEHNARDSERSLKAELTAMAAEYEDLARDAIQNEKDRDTLEASIDKLRDEKESLELELSDERVKWLGIRSPSVAMGAGGSVASAAMNPDMGATSIRMLREDFRKMMRDRTAEALRALRVCSTLR